jgi:hypothetical protein
MVRDYVAFEVSDDDFNDFLTTFQHESDRAAGVLGPAFIDDLLRELLLGRVVDARHADENLLGANRPLGSFSSRIDVAHAFGLISTADRQDLHLIRKVRNKFAHLSARITFRSAPIAEWCHGFGCVRALFQAMPNLAVAVLAHWLAKLGRNQERLLEAQAAPLPPAVE